MRKIVIFIVVLMLASCSTQQAKDILTKLFFDSKELVDEIGPIDDNETEYVEDNVDDQDNIQYEEQNNLNAKVEELEEKILKLEQQNEELRRASEEEKSEVAKYQFVDLGLSVKWATCNVGANSPEEYGEYYTFDDAQNLGSEVERVPTYEELVELKNNCDWTWTTKNGVNGYKVTSRSNGNSIFLPAAGNRNGNDGPFGEYWSGTARDSYGGGTVFLHFYSGGMEMRSDRRHYGQSVRLVQDVK